MNSEKQWPRRSVLVLAMISELHFEESPSWWKGDESKYLKKCNVMKFFRFWLSLGDTLIFDMVDGFSCILSNNKTFFHEWRYWKIHGFWVMLKLTFFTIFREFKGPTNNKFFIVSFNVDKKSIARSDITSGLIYSNFKLSMNVI